MRNLIVMSVTAVCFLFLLKLGKQLMRRLNLLLFILSWFIMAVFFIFLRNGFHDILLLVLFYFVYLASSWKAIPDSQSFLFTLVNPSGNEPIKINPNPDAAIWCRSDAGPTFGDSDVFDLIVWYADYGSTVDLGNGFKCPEKVNQTFYLAGVNPFQVSELEVFKVNM